MTERYRKWGRAVRFERGTIVDIRESGEAIEDDERFEARPLDDENDLPAVDVDIVAFAERARAAVAPGVTIERLIATAGDSEHEFGGVRWEEKSVRLHIALTHRTTRVVLDLGGELVTDVPVGDVALVSRALAYADDVRAAPPQSVLAPHVTAALLPRLHVTLIETSHGRDGKGAVISERVLDGSPHPHWFRPSYRVRPVRMPFHVRAEPTAEDVPPALPRVVALLGADEALYQDGDIAFRSTIELRRPRLVGPPRAWYPLGAGAFGSEVLL